MKILVADYTYTPDGFVKHQAIAFDEYIKDVDSLEGLLQVYPDAEIIKAKANTVIYPGFINTHVHLEFSANKTSLKYGEFMLWLNSVIENRDELMQVCDDDMMQKECKNMLRSGITSFGAISSFGADLEACQRAEQRVVFYNELIGSNAQYADMLYGDFLERIQCSQASAKEEKIIPAIAIHSPYSVHPIVLQKAVTLAKKNNYPLSSHFLESQAERQWLEKGEGDFKGFFEKYFNSSIPVTNIKEFMHAFDTYPTHFTHCVQATKDELNHLESKGHSIAHCPRSNRYLGCGRLEIENLNIPFSVATDGLSSNDSLNILDELRAALMLHQAMPISLLANKLIESITSDAANILGLNCGRIEKDRFADFALINLGKEMKDVNDIALWTILHSKEVSEVYIAGEPCEL